MFSEQQYLDYRWTTSGRRHRLMPIVIIIVAVISLLAQIPVATASSDPCVSLSTCGECIRVPNCVWCSRKTLTGSGSGGSNNKAADNVHCQLRERMVDCPYDLLVDPVPQYSIIIDTPIRGAGARALKRPDNTQLRPQQSLLTDLRIGQGFNFSVQFKVAKNYPADLYYLMDVSNSMFYDKQNLVHLADSLAETMRNITNDFQLGFGSFVDKNAVPFVTTTAASCGSYEIGCSVTYSFKNQAKLGQDVENFKDKVNSTAIVVSYDNPEGGFEALVQSIVCQQQIGWRDRARKLIVFATDAHSHLAGNGRMGGVLKPNDGACHLDGSGMYQQSLIQDYPSLGHISRLVQDNAINLIFAVTEDVSSTYNEFSLRIPGSSVGKLAEDSENIVDIIRDKYQQISSSVELRDTAQSGVKLRYYTSCLGSLVQERNRCDQLKAGDSVNFIVNIEVTECPANAADRKQSLQIYPVGVNEAMTLNYEIICDCPCERPGNPGHIPDAAECNNGGDLECGVCHCDASHSGQKCECSADANFSELESQCKSDNSSDILCSNRGNCVCGKCECQPGPNPSEIISGEFCECDNFSCDRIDGKLCSNHGDCVCGQCVCYDGWQGSACDCKTSNETCIPIGGGEICYGNGVCNCGMCKCTDNAQGKYCEDCPTCPSRCDEYKPCVQCKVFQTGPYMANNAEKCNYECTYPILVEDSVQVEQTSERDCSYENEQKCTVKFVYGFDADGSRRVRVQKEPICPQPVPALAIGLGLLAAIFIAGLLLLLIYKITTYLYDKREYARFLEESKKAKWNAETNPLYVTPHQQFQNPTYRS